MLLVLRNFALRLQTKNSTSKPRVGATLWTGVHGTGYPGTSVAMRLSASNLASLKCLRDRCQRALKTGCLFSQTRRAYNEQQREYEVFYFHFVLPFWL